MPHTNTTAAAISNALRNKGKAAAQPGRSTSWIDEQLADYGSTASTERRKRGMSGSSSGERLERVPEDEDTTEEGGSPPAWVMREAEEAEQARNIASGGEDDGEEEEEEEEGETLREAYLRTRRLYILVPLSCLLVFVLLSFLPTVLWPRSLPQPPSPSELSRVILLAASLWCLSHCLRVPTFDLISSVLSIFFLRNRRRWRRQAQEWVTLLTPYVHTTLFVTLQELLRLSSFSTLDLRWSSKHSPSEPQSHDNEDMYVFDRAFRLIWFLALGWALAEVCAGVAQGYEQLALYTDVESETKTLENGLATLPLLQSQDTTALPLGEPFEEDSLENVGLGLNLQAASISKQVAEERLHQVIPCVEIDPDDPDLKAEIHNHVPGSTDDLEGIALEENPEALDLDTAIAHLTNIKAREDLEMVYGAPFVRIPVFVAILQRFDSVLLSLGVTLTMGFTYLSSEASSADRNDGELDQRHIHWRALLLTFTILTLVHIFLGILHTPNVLSRIGVHVAAYIACLVGLGLVFAGIGMWIGLW